MYSGLRGLCVDLWCLWEEQTTVSHFWLSLFVGMGLLPFSLLPFSSGLPHMYICTHEHTSVHTLEYTSFAYFCITTHPVHLHACAHSYISSVYLHILQMCTINTCVVGCAHSGLCPSAIALSSVPLTFSLFIGRPRACALLSVSPVLDCFTSHLELVATKG